MCFDLIKIIKPYPNLSIIIKWCWSKRRWNFRILLCYLVSLLRIPFIFLGSSKLELRHHVLARVGGILGCITQPFAAPLPHLLLLHPELGRLILRPNRYLQLPKLITVVEVGGVRNLPKVFFLWHHIGIVWHPSLCFKCGLILILELLTAGIISIRSSMRCMLPDRHIPFGLVVFSLELPHQLLVVAVEPCVLKSIIYFF